MDADERRTLATVADYQFGAGAGEALFPPDDEPHVEYTRSGRPRQIHASGDRLDASGDRLVTYEEDGRFRLGLEGGRRLLEAFSPPTCRVVVGEESDPFLREGRNAFAKFVRRVGDEIRPGDEVCVTRADDTLLAVGRAELSADGMCDFDTGMAVQVREGAGEA